VAEADLQSIIDAGLVLSKAAGNSADVEMVTGRDGERVEPAQVLLTLLAVTTVLVKESAAEPRGEGSLKEYVAEELSGARGEGGTLFCRR
jgi:hypothetical protein